MACISIFLKGLYLSDGSLTEKQFIRLNGEIDGSRIHGVSEVVGSVGVSRAKHDFGPSPFPGGTQCPENVIGKRGRRRCPLPW